MRSFLLLFSGILMFAAACGGKTVGSIGAGDGGEPSGGSGSGSGSGSDNSCLESSGSSQACISCIESQCGPQLASTESGCAALIACECPGGVFDAAVADTCTMTAEEPSCSDPAQQLGQCEADYCESACETVSSGSSSSSGGPPPAGCLVDVTVECSGGAIGYACTSGSNPGTEDPSLSCSTPTAGKDDYCCFSGGAWSSTTCVPDDDLTTVCPDPTSYGYQCDVGDNPASSDFSLSCSDPVPDADGVHDDFCCSY